MTIERDGKKIELTSEELKQAFYEQRKQNYIDDITSRYEDIISRDEITKEKIIEIADSFEEAIGKRDTEDYWELMDVVFDDMI